MSLIKLSIIILTDFEHVRFNLDNKNKSNKIKVINHSNMQIHINCLKKHAYVYIFKKESKVWCNLEPSKL